MILSFKNPIMCKWHSTCDSLTSTTYICLLANLLHKTNAEAKADFFQDAEDSIESQNYIVQLEIHYNILNGLFFGKLQVSEVPFQWVYSKFD